MGFLRVRRLATHEEWLLNRPERANALGPSLAGELAVALHQLESGREKPQALVITAAPVQRGGKRLWLAGGDLKELAELTEPQQGRRYAAQLSEVCAGLAALSCPVITAIDGAAIGGGVELALAGDLRLATAATVLEFKQLKATLATGYGSCRRLVDLVGLSRAQWLLLTCATLEASEALAFGLVHQVVADAEALELAVAALCEHIGRLPEAAVAAQKKMLWHATETPAGATRQAELELFTNLWGSPEQRAFLTAFARPRETT